MVTFWTYAGESGTTLKRKATKLKLCIIGGRGSNQEISLFEKVKIA